MPDNIQARENYTRVTNILYPFSGLEKINQDIVAHAAERGSRVHKTCEGIMCGLGEMDIDHETVGYVESFKKWWSLGHDIFMMEQRFWDDDLQITGQVDLILNSPDGLTVLDLKTSSKPSKTWRAQGSAYAYLAKKSGHSIQKIQFLHLNKHGKKPDIHEYPVNDDFFLNIFHVWKYFFQKD